METVNPQTIIDSPFFKRYIDLMIAINDFYDEMVEAGIPKEDARSVLPNACTTEIGMTMNFRELRHFLKVRLASNAQLEIRELAKEIHRIMMKIVPVIVEDL